MLDRFKRNINYLRVSVTDRCNLRCTYCMPEDGIKMMSHNDVLKLEEIAEVIKVGAEKIGITKVRLTGGEPLVRKGIVNLVEMVSNIHQIEEITLTTNAILLADFADDLKKSGLNRINISLDTMNADKFKDITRGGDINKVFEGIKAAKKAGLIPIKINAVKSKSPDLEDIKNLEEYCAKEGLELRFINEMDLTEGSFSQVEGGESGNCATCNRLRLQANGNIKPCLFNNQAYNVREYGIEQAYMMALNLKPERGEISSDHKFYNIGG